MAKSQTHIVPEIVDPQRLQEYGVGIFDLIPTKSALKKAIKKEQIRVNGNIATTATIIEGGESIVYLQQQSESSNRHFDLKLEVLFEDEYLAVVLKPAGILVSGNSFRTVANALPRNLLKSKTEDAVQPQPVHRLDFATTGALMVGKTAESIRRLNRLFEDKQVEKTYYAITIGEMEARGTMADPIDNKEAVTHFTREATVKSDRFDFLNLVKLRPETGRRHQLRIHMAGLGNPILGDRDYTQESQILKGNGMYLHAFSIEFVHPFTNEKHTISAPLPERFTKIFRG